MRCACLLLAVCFLVPVVCFQSEISASTKIRQLLENQQYHQALKLLPVAHAEIERQAKETGQSYEVLSGSIGPHTFGAIAEMGDKDWGAILDDSDIPYKWKTTLIADIVEARLGKGAIYLHQNKKWVMPVEKPGVDGAAEREEKQ